MAANEINDGWLRLQLKERLAGTVPATSAEEARFPGVGSELAAELQALLPRPLIPAAVLLPIVERTDGLAVLFTRRAAQLRHHAGQISFPGGRVEERDAGPLATALRETEEEIGLSREFVALAGYLRAQLIVTGYWVVPVVGFVRPGFTLHPDPLEVEGVFEAPLAQVLDPANRRERERQLGALTLHTTEIRCGGRVIWGATAAMLVALSELLQMP